MLASQMSDVSEKLRYAFKMYDEDGSGTIDKGEMVDIVTNLYSMQGVAKVLNYSAQTLTSSYDFTEPPSTTTNIRTLYWTSLL